MTMAPMGIRLSPLGVAVFCLLGVGVIYHLYAGVLSNHLSYFRQRKKVDLRDLLAVSVEAAQLGGKEVKRVREEDSLNEKSKGETKEGAKELLTMGDLQSHRKMFNLIKNTFPEITVHSEESDSEADPVTWSRYIPDDILKLEKGREVSADSITVWIDPLDATQEYTEKLVKYVTTMVCVALEGKPVIGVIHQPFTGFTGYKVLSLLKMHSGQPEPIDEADVYVHITYIKKWDICAGAALLNALGGHMTTLKGENIDYSGTPLNKGGLVASVDVDHKAILEKLPNWDPSKH
ncbi:inositol monophosphatase 3 isoform X2 [Girardinichthys multiradiatus]|uniref:inositol monophosphatase 3 isoform X2 n=1 Tax=Girardinichthys multiradiatus TaxID=208333 RepID=UPI001FAC0311|nr:inositol monophosphatase 3 isoform X2 [Girardinichthys multiradiatus]